MSASVTLRIPVWLDLLFAWPVLLYRYFKFGYTFRRISLGEGEWTIVDPEDYYRFSKYKWCATGEGDSVYAARIIRKTVCGRARAVYLHREIMNAPKGLLVDHRNGNTRDSRKANLRLATYSQNACNSNSRIDKSKTISRFRGLIFLKRRKKWGARIGYHGKVIWLGLFTDEIDAARAYDAAAIKYHGEFARLNFSQEAKATADEIRNTKYERRIYHGEFARLNFSERSGDPRMPALPAPAIRWPGECRSRGSLAGTQTTLVTQDEIRNTRYERRIYQGEFAPAGISRYNAGRRLVMIRSFQAISCCILFALLVFLGCKSADKLIISRSNNMTAAKMTLEDAKAKRVWDIFRQISRIPRCSKNETQVIEWLKNFAAERKLACRSDAVGNTIIELPATKGYEDAPAAVLQSHVDMVCEKTPESQHDFSKDPIELIERDGWVCANGTTLGADNGIGVSLALALSEVEGLAHPKLELLFTVDEEIGLVGVNALQPGFITGKYLINLDGEDRSLIVGCAGGENTDITLPLKRQDTPAGLECFSLEVSGLLGGHSGVDIDKKRANAIKLLARTLKELQGFDMRICSIDAGRASNAIPRDAKAVILLEPAHLDEIRRTVAEMESNSRREFAKTDPNISIKLQKDADFTQKSIINQQSAIINLLLAIPTGVYRMSDEFKGTVETSNNLARVETDRDGGFLRITTMQRSFDMASMDELTGKIIDAAKSAGAEVTKSQRYPAWRPDTDSLLLRKAKEVFEKLNNKQPEVRVVHAGLEPAVIGEKFAGIEMISVGATIEDLHSPGERVNIASVDKAWEFLTTLLQKLE